MEAIHTSPLLEHVDISGESYWPKIVDDDEFKAMTGGQRAHAVVLIENGRPTIYARKGTPPQAIREEVVHFHQFYGDVAMRQRMERLGQEQLGGFDKLKPEDKLKLHIDKLEVEKVTDGDIDTVLKWHGYIGYRDASGDIFRITRHPDHSGQLSHLQVEGGKIKLGTGVQTFEERQAAAAAADWRDNVKRFDDYRHQLKDGSDANVVVST